MAIQRRRPAKRPRLVRGDPIIERVLRATLDELARVGFSAMRVEDVAARGRVNKTTVYRRWPTKPELVRAALLSMSGSSGDSLEIPDTGSLRGDLIAVARLGVKVARAPAVRGILRMLAAEGAGPDLQQLARSMQEARGAVAPLILERARARGEIAAGAHAALAFDVLRGVLRDRIIIQGEPVTDKFIEHVVDLLLAGVSPRRSR